MMTGRIFLIAIPFPTLRASGGRRNGRQKRRTAPDDGYGETFSTAMTVGLPEEVRAPAPGTATDPSIGPFLGENLTQLVRKLNPCLSSRARP
jgi:hypothetical protein